MEPNTFVVLDANLVTYLRCKGFGMGAAELQKDGKVGFSFGEDAYLTAKSWFENPTDEMVFVKSLFGERANIFAIIKRTQGGNRLSQPRFGWEGKG